MRTTEEQLQEVLRRSGKVKERRAAKRQVAIRAAASGICLCLLLVAAFFLPTSATTAEGMAGQQYGSLVLSSPYFGPLVIGILAFALGVCLTLLCLSIKNLKKQ